MVYGFASIHSTGQPRHSSVATVGSMTITLARWIRLVYGGVLLSLPMSTISRPISMNRSLRRFIGVERRARADDAWLFCCDLEVWFEGSLPPDCNFVSLRTLAGPDPTCRGDDHSQWAADYASGRLDFCRAIS